MFYILPTVHGSTGKLNMLYPPTQSNTLKTCCSMVKTSCYQVLCIGSNLGVKFGWEAPLEGFDRFVPLNAVTKD